MNYSIRGKLFKLKTKNATVDRTKNPLYQFVEIVDEVNLQQSENMRRKSSTIGVYDRKPKSQQPVIVEFDNKSHSSHKLGSLVTDWKEYSFQLILGSCELRYFVQDIKSTQENGNRSHSVFVGIIQAYTKIRAGPFVESDDLQNGERLRLHTIELAIQVCRVYSLASV